MEQLVRKLLDQIKELLPSRRNDPPLVFIPVSEKFDEGKIPFRRQRFVG